MRSATLWSLILFHLATGVTLAESSFPSTGKGIVDVTIDTTKPAPAINPFIYGQFIEHLGRCIYGGIWSEMLEDRKFLFPITNEYKPYRDLTNTKFPVIGASPWEVVGPASSVSMVKEDAFVGEHSPRVAAGNAIRQNDLGVVAGRKYVGYIWLRAAEGKSTVRVSLAQGDGKEHKDSATFTVGSEEFARFPFSYTGARTNDHSRLLIEVVDNPCFIGAVSLMPADNIRGFRADTLNLMKQLHGTIYRWPGGNFVSGYDWRDGIGPRDKRPPRRNPAWTGIDSNDVGIDEFLDLCHEIDATPMIAVNTGFGDDYSAAQEVEYVNGAADTIGGSWRVKYGQAKPYGVKYWCVGNEMFGEWQLGRMRLGHYTKKHNRVADAMLKADASLALVGSGDLATEDSLESGKDAKKIGWSAGMLERCGDHMDLISEHFYCGRVPWTKDGKLPVEEHAGLLRAEIRKKATAHRELQAKLGRTADKFIPIAMDEWNYWHRDYIYGELGCQYDLADALGVAAGLHEYFRNSDVIHMAHYAQTVNVIGCIKTTKSDAFFDTTALPLLLYRREFGAIPLPVSGTYDEGRLDVAAARTADSKAITIGVVNSQSTKQKLHVKLQGATPSSEAMVWRISASDAEATNTPEKQDVTIVAEKSAKFGDNITVPPFSINLYRVPTN